MPTPPSDSATEDMPGWKPYTEPNPFVLYIGPVWHRLVDGDSEYAFRGRDVHGNLNGVVHGGMLTAFADQSLGHAAWQDNGGHSVVTAHLAVSFVSAARLGELVTCRVEIIRKTRSLYFLRGDMMVEDRCVAAANGVWKILGA